MWGGAVRYKMYAHVCTYYNIYFLQCNNFHYSTCKVRGSAVGCKMYAYELIIIFITVLTGNVLTYVTCKGAIIWFTFCSKVPLIFTVCLCVLCICASVCVSVCE